MGENDLVSREVAIEAIEQYDFVYPKYMERFVIELRDAIKADLKDDIEELPSAQPSEWLENYVSAILQAGLEGREVSFRVGNRTFAVRELNDER